MTTRRSDIVVQDEIGVYHCYSRCVRRSFLCGVDSVTGKDYSYRKGWIDVRLQQLAQVFMIDILSYAILDNHFHKGLRNRPDLVAKLSDREVVRRSLMLSPSSMPEEPELVEPDQALIEKALKDKEHISKWRQRLSDISWFNRYLKEPIARRVNQEEGSSGHFWSERFKCVRLLDEYAVLLCCIYIDLNEVRAKKANTPEESLNSSVGKRIHTWRSKSKTPDEHNSNVQTKSKKQRRREQAPPWLAPIDETSHNGTNTGTMTEEQPKSKSFRASDTGFLGMSLEQYLEMVDWTGRCIRNGKKGSIPVYVAPIMERLINNLDAFLFCAQNFGRVFKRFCGSPTLLLEQMRRNEKQRIVGIQTARILY